MATQLDFTTLRDQRSQVEREALALLGGKVDESTLLDWFQRWQLGKIALPWRIWESVSDLRFERSTLPDSFHLLERGRLFGEDGDLTLRRDGERFRWWFVGKPAVVPESMQRDIAVSNFWQSHPSTTLSAIEQSAILWGSHRGNNQNKAPYWYDDRVGWAKLTYPVTQNGKAARHLYIHYREYLQAGQVAFVWLYDVNEKGE